MKREFIVCSAIWIRDGKKRTHTPFNIETGIVIYGLRHHNCYEILSEMFPDRRYIGKETEGFLTSKNKFVDRHIGLAIAERNGQLKDEKNGADNELYSEDIF